jgi:hypothetical protein
MARPPFASFPSQAFLSTLRAALQRDPPLSGDRIDRRFTDFVGVLSGHGVAGDDYPTRFEARRHYRDWHARFVLFDECLRRLSPWQGQLTEEHAEALAGFGKLRTRRAGLDTPWQQLPVALRTCTPKRVFVDLFEARMFDYVPYRNSQTLVPSYTIAITDSGRQLISKWKPPKPKSVAHLEAETLRP